MKKMKIRMYIIFVFQDLQLDIDNRENKINIQSINKAKIYPEVFIVEKTDKSVRYDSKNRAESNDNT